jgi:hypothetical protein
LKEKQLQAEMRDKQRLAEQQERDKDRAFELERLKADLAKEQLRVELQRLQTLPDNKSQNGSHESSDEETTGKNPTARKSTPRGPKITPFGENDEIDSYLHRFEQYATAQRWDQANWAVYLAALLKGKALDVYARLPTSQANDYNVLKDALLKRYNKTEEGYKQLFHTCKGEPNESPRQFIVRLSSYLTKWIQLAKVADG